MANFGNESIEASTGQLSNNILGLVTTSGAAGNIESITAYLAPTGTRNVRFAIYRSSDDALIGQTNEISISSTGWHTANFASPVPVAASTGYYILAWADGSFQCTIARASQSSGGRFRGITYAANFPDPSGTSNNNFRYSIYATYESPSATLPTVTTGAATDVNHNSANLNGNVTDAGGEEITRRGFVYGTTTQTDPGDTDPDVSDYDSVVDETDTDFGTGAFSLPITGLTPEDVYYVRAFAENAEGFAYGSEIELTTLAEPQAMHVQAWFYPGAPADNAPVEYSDGRRIEVLKPEYYRLLTDGTLDLIEDEGGATLNAYSVDNALDVLDNCVEAFFTVSGHTAGLEAMLGDVSTSIDSTKRANFISTLVSFCQTINFHGVDVNIEGFSDWDSTTTGRLYDLLDDLGIALHAVGKKLAYSLPPIWNDATGGSNEWDGLDSQALYEITYEAFNSITIDYITIMAYDYQWDWGSQKPVQPLAWLDDIITWAKSKITDHSKIVIGIPTYGYTAPNTEWDYDIALKTKTQQSTETGFSGATRNLDLVDNGTDYESGELFWTNGGNFYTFGDEDTMRIKGERVQSHGIYKISVWHLGGNDWYQFPIAEERGAKILGKETENATRGAKVTGSENDTEERDARLIGQDVSNAERSATLTGEEEASQEREAIITGKDSESATRGAKTTGTETTNAERDAHIYAKDNDSSQRGGRINVSGGEGSERNAITTGQATDNESRSAKTRGNQPESATRVAILVGTDTQNSSRTMHMYGLDTALDEIFAKLTGKQDTDSQREAVANGVQRADDSRLMHLYAEAMATDEIGATIEGVQIVSSYRMCKLIGKLIVGRPTILKSVYGSSVLGSKPGSTPLPGGSPITF